MTMEKTFDISFYFLYMTDYLINKTMSLQDRVENNIKILLNSQLEENRTL
jgi:hypothetical protein